MKIKAYAAKKPHSLLEEFEYESRQLLQEDVHVEIGYCGICHSYVHILDGEWGNLFPVVPGHEIIGTVIKKGKNVLNLKEGDRVGIGWLCNSCNNCEHCKNSEEIFCKKRQATCFGNYGGFAESIIVNSRFAFKIPEKLKSEEAACLLCGGVTVFSTLKRHVKKGMKIGVIGIGGLGHLAIQFADKMKCEVTAFSTSIDKEFEAKKLGADKFVFIANHQSFATKEDSIAESGSLTVNRKSKAVHYSKNMTRLEELEGYFDFIISTVPKNLNWKDYLKMLKPKGVLCYVGIFTEQMNLFLDDLITGNKTITGSATGGTKMIKEMLRFASENNVKAKAEIIEMSNLNEGIEKVRKNRARYRVVLKKEV